MTQRWTALANSNLGLTVDRYHTKEGPLQKTSKVVKFCQSKFHCVACVLLVACIIGQNPTWLYMSVAWIWSNLNFVMIFFMNCLHDFIYEYSMNLIKLKFCDHLVCELLRSIVRYSGIRNIQKHIHPTETDLKASQFWHLSCSQRSHPVCAWKLEQKHKLLLMIYFKYGSHWYVEKVSPDDAASLRLMYILTSLA